MPPGIDPNTLLQLLMQLLTQSPSQPAGDIAGGTTPIGPPAFAKTPDPQAAALTQLLQNLQMQQAANPQQAMNAAAGVQGGPFGQMGGRPPGS